MVRNTFRKLNHLLRVLETVVSGGLVFVVFVVVLSQVLMRYLFSYPNPWSEELSRFCFIWLSMLGAALAVEHRSHFGFDQVVKRLAPSRRNWLLRSTDIVLAVVALLFISAGLTLVELALPQRSPALNLSMAWLYAAVPVSGILMLVHVIAPRDQSQEDRL